MKEIFKIKTFDSILDLYQASNFNRIPKFQNFDIFTFSETYPSVKKMLFPHKRNFFTILFLENQDDGKITINDSKYQTLNNTIICQSFEHIFSFIRGENMKGIIVLFKDSFLLPIISQVITDFNYFSSLKNNTFHLNKKEKLECEALLKNLLSESNHKNISKYLLVSFLEKIKTIQEQYQTEEKFVSKSYQLVKSFQQLISNHFLEYKNVDFYAQKLNITPNHLNETIKEQTGKTAKKMISERIVLEAKKLLLYSEMDIAEISHYLDFSEPSHFGKFFKKETSFTPKEFRQNP